MTRPPFPLSVIQALEPSSQQLLTMICEQLSDEAIMFIARADYGYGAASNFTELKQLVRDKVFPAQMDAGVHEVLTLTRWSRPETTGELLARSYACVLLLNLSPESTYGESAESSSLIGLVDGALKLPGKFRRPVMQFVAWKVLHLYELELACCREDGDNIDDIYFERYSLFALLLMMVMNDEPQESVQPILDLLTDYKDTAEERAAVIAELLQDSGVQEEMWRSAVRQLLPSW